MQQRIDVHHHFLTDRYVQEMSNAGITDVDGFPLPSWSAVDSLAMMDRQHIATAMLSISSPGLGFTAGAAAAALARAVNEENAWMTAAYPARFGGFALLPLPDIDAALAELAYALDVLKLDGVGLYSNYAGRYLGDPAFRPLFEELNRRRAVIFVHPTHPPGFERLALGFPAPMLEYPFENTRMVCNLIATGQLRACPDIKLIVPHGGGTLPYLTQRLLPLIAAFNTAQPKLTMPEIMPLLRSLYYDVTATAAPNALPALRNLATPDKLLYGSDFPFMPEMSVPMAMKTLNDAHFLNEHDRAAMNELNPSALFPRLAGERCVPDREPAERKRTGKAAAHDADVPNGLSAVHPTAAKRAT